LHLAQKLFVALAWLCVVAVAIQFLLAGLGVLGGESLDPHRQWGFTALHLIPILMIVAALVGRMGRTTVALSVALFLLVFLQPVFASVELRPTWLRSLHVLNALLIAVVGYQLAQRARMRRAANRAPTTSNTQ
jgi:hypothetical protein